MPCVYACSTQSIGILSRVLTTKSCPGPGVGCSLAVRPAQLAPEPRRTRWTCGRSTTDTVAAHRLAGGCPPFSQTADRNQPRFLGARGPCQYTHGEHVATPGGRVEAGAARPPCAKTWPPMPEMMSHQALRPAACPLKTPTQSQGRSSPLGRGVRRVNHGDTRTSAP